MIIISTICAVITGLIILRLKPGMAKLVLIIYGCGILYAAFLSRIAVRSDWYEFHPFLTGMKTLRATKNVIEYYKTGTGFSGEIFEILQDITLNILMFVPFGYLIPDIFQKIDGVEKLLSLAFIGSLIIEICQHATGLGMFDAFDLLFNTLGAAIGFLCYKLYLKNHAPLR